MPDQSLDGPAAPALVNCLWDYQQQAVLALAELPENVGMRSSLAYALLTKLAQGHGAAPHFSEPTQQARPQPADTFCPRAGEQLVPAPGPAESTADSADGAGEESGFLPSLPLAPRATDKGASRRPDGRFATLSGITRGQRAGSDLPCANCAPCCASVPLRWRKPGITRAGSPETAECGSGAGRGDARKSAKRHIRHLSGGRGEEEKKTENSVPASGEEHLALVLRSGKLGE